MPRARPLLMVGLALAGLAACGAAAPSPTTDTTVPVTVTTTPPSLPTGSRTRVSNTAELRAALGTLTSGSVIELNAGSYPVTAETFALPEGLTDVAITGATGRREDVVVTGGRFGFWANAVTRLTIQDLTIQGASEHGILLNCAAHAPVVRNVLMRDIGDQFLKANPGSGGCAVDDGVVEDSWFEYTAGAPDTYTNAIDVHSGQNWIVRRNTFKRFSMSAGGLVGPAVLLWNGARNTVVSDNRFEDNSRDIALGLDPNHTAQPPVSNGSLTDHQGGVVSGNSITRRAGLPGADVAISIADSPGTRVERNTVVMAGTYPNAIEYRFPRTQGVVISGNDTDARIQARDGATGTVSGNTTR